MPHKHCWFCPYISSPPLVHAWPSSLYVIHWFSPCCTWPCGFHFACLPISVFQCQPPLPANPCRPSSHSASLTYDKLSLLQPDTGSIRSPFCMLYAEAEQPKQCSMQRISRIAFNIRICEHPNKRQCSDVLSTTVGASLWARRHLLTGKLIRKRTFVRIISHWIHDTPILCHFLLTLQLFIQDILPTVLPRVTDTQTFEDQE